MKKVVLYSTHCPKCNVLSQKLNRKQVEYEEINDVEIMESKGFKQAPMLEVDGEVMDFSLANKWIESLPERTE